MNRFDKAAAELETVQKLATQVAERTGLDVRYVWDKLAEGLAEAGDTLPEGDVFTPSLVKAAHEWLEARKVALRAGVSGTLQDKTVMQVVATMTPNVIRAFNEAYNNPEHGAHGSARGLYAEARRVLDND